MAIDPSSAFQRFVFMSGRGFTYFAQTPGLPLSLKSMSNGRALYRFDRNEVAVDDDGYLILNNRQPYSIEIASPTRVETFVLWFPDGWAGDVSRCSSNSAERLLAELLNNGAAQPGFSSHYTPHDRTVSPKLRKLRAALKSNDLMNDGWLEEQLRDLLAAMLAKQDRFKHEVGNLPAERISTREELWKRVNQARDYLHANLRSRVGLADVATAACLSPFHLLRVFRAAFRQSPHDYLSRCRLERAKFLLEKTTIPVTSVCLECGFSSLGSFSSLFRTKCGMSPRAWRQKYGHLSEENSKIREVYLIGAA
jgi:AraC family transcriptional regulator